MKKEKKAGIFFVMPGDPPGKAFSSETITNGLREAGLSTEPQQKPYKKEKPLVYAVTTKFIKALYANKPTWPALSFSIFMERQKDGSFQIFRLFEPMIMRKSRARRQADKKSAHKSKKAPSQS